MGIEEGKTQDRLPPHAHSTDPPAAAAAGLSGQEKREGLQGGRAKRKQKSSMGETWCVGRENKRGERATDGRNSSKQQRQQQLENKRTCAAAITLTHPFMPPAGQRRAAQPHGQRGDGASLQSGEVKLERKDGEKKTHLHTEKKKRRNRKNGKMGEKILFAILLFFVVFFFSFFSPFNHTNTSGAWEKTHPLPMFVRCDEVRCRCCVSAAAAAAAVL